MRVVWKPGAMHARFICYNEAEPQNGNENLYVADLATDRHYQYAHRLLL